MLPRGSQCGQHLSRPGVHFEGNSDLCAQHTALRAHAWISYDLEARSTSPNGEKGRGATDPGKHCLLNTRRTPTLRDTGLPVIIVTHIGKKTGAVR